jgi:hypothetical protein
MHPHSLGWGLVRIGTTSRAGSKPTSLAMVLTSTNKVFNFGDEI